MTGAKDGHRAARDPRQPKGQLEALAAAARKDRALPPVDRWNPPDGGDIDMRIDVDGGWHYMGSPIARPAMVRLFSTILRRDGARYVLVTPVEKYTVTVDDAPFVAVELEVVGRGRAQRLVFRTNVDDAVSAGPAHALRVQTDPVTGTPRPYIHVRGGLEARIARAVFYELVDLAEVQNAGTPVPMLGVWSEGCFFPLGPAPESGA